jgi:probable HAF family extracellular repeat protein
MRLVSILFLSLVLQVLPTAARAQNATFTPLGHLQGGSLDSRAFAVSRDGDTVVGQATISNSNGVRAFRWTQAGGMESLGAFQSAAPSSIANGVSADGSVIVGESNNANNNTDMFRWTEADGIERLDGIVEGLIGGSAADVSNDGDWIVGSMALESLGGSIPTTTAFLWNDGIFNQLGAPGGYDTSHATATDANAFVTVGTLRLQTGTTREAFWWEGIDGFRTIGDLPDAPGFEKSLSAARDVSEDGKTIVGEGLFNELFFENVLAFRWTEADGMISLGDLPGGGPPDFSVAYGVTADGATVVGESSTDFFNSFTEAFIWDETSGMRKLSDVVTQDYGLDLGTWVLVSARAITPDGSTIVGYGKPFPTFDVFEAFVIRLPEPAGGTWAAIATLALLARRRRRLPRAEARTA